jgi:hypothetical protein
MTRSGLGAKKRDAVQQGGVDSWNSAIERIDLTAP